MRQNDWGADPQSPARPGLAGGDRLPGFRDLAKRASSEFMQRAPFIRQAQGMGTAVDQPHTQRGLEFGHSA